MACGTILRTGARQFLSAAATGKALTGRHLPRSASSYVPALGPWDQETAWSLRGQGGSTSLNVGERVAMLSFKRALGRQLAAARKIAEIAVIFGRRPTSYSRLTALSLLV